MPNTNLILRTLTSPYGDVTLGSVLSHADLDNNFIYLKGEIIQNVSLLGANLILTKIDGNTLSVNLNNFIGGGGSEVTGGTYDNTTGSATFTNSTGGTFVVSGFTTGGTGNVTYTNSTPTSQTIGGIAAGSTFNAQTMQQMWDALLYPYQNPAFTSFSIQGVSSPYEIGQVIGVNQTFLWANSNHPNISANTISIAGYNLTTLTGLANDGNEAVTFTGAITRTAADSGGTRSWTITGTNTKNNTFSTTFTMRWDYKLYAGTSANTSLTENQIEALANYNSVKQGFSGTYNMSAGGYKYWCFANEYGTPNSFKDASNGLNIAMNDTYANTDSKGNTYDLVSVTNANSEQTNYRVYRTKYVLNGSIDVTIA